MGSAWLLFLLRFLCDPHAEQAGGPEYEDEDQHGEHDGVCPLYAEAEAGSILVAHCFYQADDETSKHGTGDVTDTAQDGSGERFEARLIALHKLGATDVHAIY